MSPAEKMQAWAEKLIADARPGPTSTPSSVQGLVNVHLFLQGKRSQLFGMQTSPTAFATPEALGRCASDALRSWFEHYESIGEADSQASLWNATQLLALDMALPEPPAVKRRRMLTEARDRAFSELAKPNEACGEASQELADALVRIRANVKGTFFEKFGKYIGSVDRADLNAANFEWLEDSWLEFADVPTDPCFLPIAGADGDYIGVLIHPVFRGEQCPVVFSFHEESPRMYWIAASAEHLERVVEQAAKAGKDRKKRIDEARGPRSDFVTSLLDMPDGGSSQLPEWVIDERLKAFEWASNGLDDAAAAALDEAYVRADATFPTISLRAQRLTREWAATLRSA